MSITPPSGPGYSPEIFVDQITRGSRPICWSRVTEAREFWTRDSHNPFGFVDHFIEIDGVRYGYHFPAIITEALRRA